MRMDSLSTFNIRIIADISRFFYFIFFMNKLKNEASK